MQQTTEVKDQQQNSRGCGARVNADADVGGIVRPSDCSRCRWRLGTVLWQSRSPRVHTISGWLQHNAQQQSESELV